MPTEPLPGSDITIRPDQPIRGFIGELPVDAPALLARLEELERRQKTDAAWIAALQDRIEALERLADPDELAGVRAGLEAGRHAEH